jgi:hypothetical protein
MIGMALGRSAITPIVDALAICSALSIILCLVILLRRRRIDLTPASFSVPGGLIMIWTAMLGALAMVGVAVFKPFLESNGELPTEWILLSAWGLLGGVVWFATRRLRENGQHRARELEG